jgi:hypothetical protein
MPAVCPKKPSLVPGPRRRNPAGKGSQLVAKLPEMDLFEVAVTLLDITFEVQHKYLPPLHAYAIFEAAVRRIDQLAGEAWVAREQARIAAEQMAHRQPVPSTNSNQSNRLQPSPIK